VSFEIQPVTPERWPDMVELFERRGPRGGRRNTPAYGCWCMYWRDRSLEHGEPKKRAMAKLVRAPQYRPRDEGGGPAVWAIVCFAIDKDARNKGIAPELLDAAVEYAFAHGATSVEAYPHVSNATDYMGHTELYRRAGFAHVRDANKRAIVRIE